MRISDSSSDVCSSDRAGELVGERQRADGGEVDGAGFKRLPGHAGFEFAEVGVAGFEAEPLVELVAAERGEGGVLVVVAGFVDERLAGTGAKVEAGFFGRLRAEGGGADQGDRKSVVWGKGVGGGEGLGGGRC